MNEIQIKDKKYQIVIKDLNESVDYLKSEQSESIMMIKNINNQSRDIDSRVD